MRKKEPVRVEPQLPAAIRNVPTSGAAPEDDCETPVGSGEVSPPDGGGSLGSGSSVTVGSCALAGAAANSERPMRKIGRTRKARDIGGCPFATGRQPKGAAGADFDCG